MTRFGGLKAVSVGLTLTAAVMYFTPLLAAILIIASCAAALLSCGKTCRSVTALSTVGIAISSIALAFWRSPYSLPLSLIAFIPAGIASWIMCGKGRPSLIGAGLSLIGFGAAGIAITPQHAGSISAGLEDVVLLSPYSTAALTGLIIYVAVLVPQLPKLIPQEIPQTPA